MEAQLQKIQSEAFHAITAARDAGELEVAGKRYLGRRGQLTILLQQLPHQPIAMRPKLGRLANTVKREIEQALERRRSQFRPAVSGASLSLPGERPQRGHLHPISQFCRKMLDVWRALGYEFHEGPELEYDWYNFSGLNIPIDHPSRDIHDTFFIKGRSELVLRTHASTVQLRAIQHARQAGRTPPYKFVEIGKVFRHEATDATHESMFFHCDGVAIDRGLTMANLIGTLRTFLRTIFGDQARISVRPSHFPFVEPGIEIFMERHVNGQQQWLEMLGAGMVHPNVIKAMKLDPRVWRGFAFGLGVDRLMMLHYGISDVRLSYSGSLSFLRQF